MFNQIRFFAVALYGFSLLTSMAGMEIFSWTLFAMAVGLAVGTIRRGGAFSWRLGPDHWLLGFLSIHILSLLLSPYVDSMVMRIGDLRWVLLVYGLTYVMRSMSLDEIRRVFRWIFILTIVVASYSLIQFIFGVQWFRSRQTVWPSGEFFRATGLFNLSLTFAYSIGLIGLVGAGAVMRLDVRQWFSSENRWASAAFFASIVGCVSSMTRGSWVALLAAAVAVLLLVRPKRLIGLGVAVTALVLVGVTFSTGLRERVTSITNLKYPSNEHRLIIWEAQWGVYKAHPWLGVGLGLNKFLTNEYFDKGRGFDLEQSEAFFAEKKIPRQDIAVHSHNNYLQMLLGAGPLGLLAYLGLCGWFLLAAWRLYRDSSGVAGVAWISDFGLGLFAAQIFLHVGGLTECNFTDGEVNHMLIFLWATLLALRGRWAAASVP